MLMLSPPTCLKPAMMTDEEIEAHNAAIMRRLNRRMTCATEAPSMLHRVMAGSNRTAVLRALSAKAATSAAIATQMGLPTHVVSTTLSSLGRLGLTAKLPGAYPPLWCVTERGGEVLGEIAHHAPEPSAPLPPAGSDRASVLVAMLDGPGASGEIARRIAMRPERTSKIIVSLRDDNLAARVGETRRWTLTPAGVEAAKAVAGEGE